MGFRATGTGSLEHTPDVPRKSGNVICVQKPSIQPGASLAASDGHGVWPGPGAHAERDHRAGPPAEDHGWPCQGSPGPPLASLGQGSLPDLSVAGPLFPARPCRHPASLFPLPQSLDRNPPGPTLHLPHESFVLPLPGRLAFFRQPPPPDLTPQIPSLSTPPADGL